MPLSIVSIPKCAAPATVVNPSDQVNKALELLR